MWLLDGGGFTTGFVDLMMWGTGPLETARQEDAEDQTKSFLVHLDHHHQVPGLRLPGSCGRGFGQGAYLGILKAVDCRAPIGSVLSVSSAASKTNPVRTREATYHLATAQITNELSVDRKIAHGLVELEGCLQNWRLDSTLK